MERTRLEQKSIYYFIKSLFPDFITIVEEFPQNTELSLPTIAVIYDVLDPRPFQLGSNELDYRDWAIYIFAENKGQLADYADRIMNNIKNNICVYDYNQGFPPDVSPDQIGSLVVENRKYTPLRTFDDLVMKKYWWGVVTFLTHPSTTT